MKKLLDLCQEHSRLSSGLEGQEPRDISGFRLKQEDNRLKYLKVCPLAFELVNCVMHFKQVLDSPSGINSIPSGHDVNTTSSLNPTLFPLIRQQYRDGVIHLVSQKSFPGLSQQDLVVFKEEFGPTAFVCHFRGCERSLVGFPTATALKDHEARHSGLLRCLEPGCSYNKDVGFTTLSQVKKHKRKAHPECLNGEMPYKIRRRISSKEGAPKVPEPGLDSDAQADATRPATVLNLDGTRIAIPDHIMDQVNMVFQAPAGPGERSEPFTSRWFGEIEKTYGLTLMEIERTGKGISDIDETFRDRA